MGQREKPKGGAAGADTRDALAKLARLISVGDESVESARMAADAAAAGTGAEDSAFLSSLREPGATQLLEALPAGLAVYDGEEMVKANSAFALAFGYRSAEELQSAGGIDQVFPGGTGKLTKHLARDASGKPLELQGRSRSGREFTVPVAVHPIAAEGEAQAGLIVLHPETSPFAEPRDAQDGGGPAPAKKPAKGKDKKRKKDKKNKKQARHRETEKAAPTPGTFDRMNKTEFLAKVSHELRTPLNSIIGFAELMKDEQLGPIGNDRYRGYIRDIHDSGLYALSLVNDLLDISKIEAGEFELNFAAVDLEEVVSESVHSMEPQAQRHRVLLRTSFAEDTPPVLADRRSIRQILLNLVSNGIKFTKPGGQVIVSTQRTEDGGVRIRVRDTGIGMTKNEIAQALEPFQQVDTAPRKQAGTGLGLPLTKALVEANRAAFRLRSFTDSGTRIDVTFPSERMAGTPE